MPRNWSEAVPVGSGSVRHDEAGPDKPTLADLYLMIEEKIKRQLNIMESHFDQQHETLNELMGSTRGTRQRSANLKQDTR